MLVKNQVYEAVVTDYTAVPLLKPIFIGGEQVYELPALHSIREYCGTQIASLWEEVRRFENPHRYYVDLSQRLWDIKQELLRAKSN